MSTNLAHRCCWVKVVQSRGYHAIFFLYFSYYVSLLCTKIKGKFGSLSRGGRGSEICMSAHDVTGSSGWGFAKSQALKAKR